MLKKNITYEDYDGNVREEAFYFNLKQSELVELEMSKAGGLKRRLETIINTRDGVEIAKTFKEIILKSYGIKSDDGKRFIKSEEISAEFEQTEAFSVLYMELLSDAEKAAAFLNAIVPKELSEKAKNISVK